MQQFMSAPVGVMWKRESDEREGEKRNSQQSRIRVVCKDVLRKDKSK